MSLTASYGAIKIGEIEYEEMKDPSDILKKEEMYEAVVI